MLDVFLRTESFSSSFDIGVLYERLIGQNSMVFFTSKIFPFLVIKTLDSDPEQDLDLDPEPDPH